MQFYKLNIDKKQLKKQINDLLSSNISEDSKTGLHNLLGDILDQCGNSYINGNIIGLNLAEKVITGIMSFEVPFSVDLHLGKAQIAIIQNPLFQ